MRIHVVQLLPLRFEYISEHTSEHTTSGHTIYPAFRVASSDRFCFRRYFSTCSPSEASKGCKSLHNWKPVYSVCWVKLLGISVGRGLHNIVGIRRDVMTVSQNIYRGVPRPWDCFSISFTRFRVLGVVQSWSKGGAAPEKICAPLPQHASPPQAHEGWEQQKRLPCSAE